MVFCVDMQKTDTMPTWVTISAQRSITYGNMVVSCWYLFVVVRLKEFSLNFRNVRENYKS